MNINGLWSCQCFSRSESNMICCIYVTAFTNSVCPILIFFVFPLTRLFCLSPSASVVCSSVHACGLTSFKTLQPSERDLKQRKPSCDCSREDWRRGIAHEGREGLDDRVARQTRITWAAQICLQTETVRPGKTQEPSWRILLAGLTRTHLWLPDACVLARIFVEWAKGLLFVLSTFLMEGLREQMVLGGEKKYAPTQAHT